MQVQPYLFFEGRCEEALEFYKSALDAEVLTISRYKESPPQDRPGMVAPGFEEKIMHAGFRIGDTTMFASDGHNAGSITYKGFALSIEVQDAATVDRYFNALANGGTIQMPAGETFYAQRFGMVTDRFGILWMLITHKK